MNKLAACLLILSSTGIAQDGLVLDAALLDGTNGSILHTTPRQECRGVIITGNDRVFTLGVESDGSNLLNETRQFVSLAAWKDDHWVRLGSVSDSGYAYSPAAAPDGRNGLWIAWAQFNAIARDWDIYARHYDGQQFGETTRVSSNRGPDLRPAITFAAGAPLIVWEEGVAWEAGAAGSMQIASATLENGRWQESKVTSGGSSPRQRAEFRRQLPEFASVMGWIGRSASVYRLLVRQRNPQRIEDFCLAGVGNRQPCDAGLLIHSIFQ